MVLVRPALQNFAKTTMRVTTIAGGGRSAPVRPNDTGLNGIRTSERTHPTSAPGYMPRHPTPRPLKPSAVRDVDGGVNLRYPPACSGGDFRNRGACRACTFPSFTLLHITHRFWLSPPFPKPQYIPILGRFFPWHARGSDPPRWARWSLVLGEILTLQAICQNLF